MSEGGLSWAEGALDGVFGHHVGVTDPQKRTSQILKALRNLLGDANDVNLKVLYQTVIADQMLGAADSLRERIQKQSADYDQKKLTAVARYFAMRSGHQEAVKFGIVLIGVAGMRADTDILMKLGGHDEFSLFAAVALGRTATNPEQSLWELAQQVHGWGRIHIVERLARTNEPQIKAWLLREGFRNSVMDNYLACVCARACRLHEALTAPVVDRRLLDGAADIFRALIAGGPAEGIDDYEHAADAAEAYVNHVWADRGLDLRHFLTVDDILRYVDDPAKKDARLRRSWTEKCEGQIRTMCKDILSLELWRDLVYQGLATNDEATFYEADLAARKIGISTRDLHFAKVRAAPTMSSSWYELLRQTQEDQIDEVLGFAESALPLEKIATGPAEELGLGPGFEPHRALLWLLQDLKRFPGHGWVLIRTGLQSPVVNNRNWAVKALSAWPAEKWPPDAIGVIRKALEIEPNAKTKQSLLELLQQTTIT